jgi:hypothetical protein
MMTDEHVIESDALSTCSGCGAEAESVIGCPDGAELCESCFDSGQH